MTTAPIPSRIPLDIVFVSGGLPHWGGVLAERSLGGSETAAVLVSRALAARGHNVTVFSPGHQGGRWDGVTYLPMEAFGGYVSGVPHDVCVISRVPDWFQSLPRCTLGVLWCHDLALKPQRAMLGSVMWTVDMVFTLSAFQCQQYQTVHAGLPAEVFRTTRNGIDVAAVRKAAERERRSPIRVAYGSRPERGLEAVLMVAEVSAKNGMPYEFFIAGYDCPVPQFEGMYRALEAKARSLPNVRWMGPLKQADWHGLLGSSAFWLYPGCGGQFREISCLSAMEAMCAGAVPIAVAKGALPETIGDGGILIGDESTEPNDPLHLTACLQAMEKLRADQMEYKRVQQRALKRGAALDWAGVAEQWEGWWYDELRRRTSDPQKLRRHLERTGDREAAAAL